jgi:hypothetical protein
MATTIRGDDNWDTTPPAYGRVVRTAGSVSTTSTSLVDLTGASITITTGANPINFSGCYSVRNSGLGNDMVFNFTIDDVLQFGTSGLVEDQNEDDNRWNMVSPQGQSAVLSAGSHTIKQQWKVGAGTGLILASSANSAMFFVNEIK